ncbi:hypothetical protein HMPREF0185_03014 [Brevundimonas diminuta 470-4]|nr:hypothetical protein HMPREF0185_03014 [Brevundimonas diminuta 470-4]
MRRGRLFSIPVRATGQGAATGEQAWPPMRSLYISEWRTA